MQHPGEPSDPAPVAAWQGAVIGLGAIVLAAVVVFALSQLNLPRVGHALITATPGWIALALLLMGSSLVLRSISWPQTLRAALPDTPIHMAPVARATMIGVMGWAVFPGRIGEPSRVLVLTRRLDGPNRRLLPIVAGTVFSQTLINLLAPAILLAVTFTSVPPLHGHPTGIEAAIGPPLLIAMLVVPGPRLLELGRRSRSARVARGQRGQADARPAPGRARSRSRRRAIPTRDWLRLRPAPGACHVARPHAAHTVATEWILMDWARDLHRCRGVMDDDERARG